jgi:hypothetical protein
MIRRWLRRRSESGPDMAMLGLPDPGAVPPGLPWPDAVPPGLPGLPGADEVPPELAAWAQVVDVSRLTDRTIRQAEEYLRTYRRMAPVARRELAWRLVAVVQAQASPPPPVNAAPLDILATVLAARRKQLGY